MAYPPEPKKTDPAPGANLGTAVLVTIEKIVTDTILPVIKDQQQRVEDQIVGAHEYLVQFEQRISELERRFGTEPREAVERDIQRLEQRLKLLRSGLG